MNAIPDQPQIATFSLWADVDKTEPLDPAPTTVIFTLSVFGSSNDAAHPATSHRVGVDPNATPVDDQPAPTYQLEFTPSDYGIWRVDMDAFNAGGVAVGAQFATVIIDPRPAAIPVPA